MKQGDILPPLNTEFEKRVIWNFAGTAPGRDKTSWRLDCFDRLMCWAEYRLHTEFGWEIAVMNRHASVNLSNKIPLHWISVKEMIATDGRVATVRK